MFDLMNEIAELIYVSDPETYELLYVNDRGREALGVAHPLGELCYRMLQNRDTPCPFCTNCDITTDHTYTWEYQNPVTGRNYLLKARIVDWNGRRARMEIAVDITEQAEERKALEHTLRAEQLMLHCIQRLHLATDFSQGISDMLQHLGSELLADRAYVFELVSNGMSNTFEWCRPGVTSQINQLQNLDLSLIDRWQEAFQRGECVIIERVEDLRESSVDEYHLLTTQNVHSLVVAPLETVDGLAGFVGVDNPLVDMIRNIQPLLSTLRYFLMTTMRRISTQQKLTELSFIDSLTRLYNRNRYTIDVAELSNYEGSVGVVFMDLNGLKELNDSAGHLAGDSALIQCAAQISAYFQKGECYRIGGDEFVALQRDITQTEFETAVADFRAQFSAQSKYHVAVGARWSSHTCGLRQLIKAADTDMYEDKRRFYRDRYIQDPTSNPPQEINTAGEDSRIINLLQVCASKHLLQDDFRMVWANDHFYGLSGYSAPEFDAQFQGSFSRYFEALPMEFLRLYSIIQDAFRAGKPGYEAVLRLPVKGGHVTFVKLVGTFTNETIDGTPVTYVALTDVNDLVQMQREQSVVYEGLPGFVFKVRVNVQDSYFLYGNPQFISRFGEIDVHGANEMIRENLRLNAGVIDPCRAQMREGLPITLEAQTVDLSGVRGYYRICAGCVDWFETDPIYLAICIDITEMVKQREDLCILAYIDPVTEGRNRLRFELDASHALTTSPPDTYFLVSFDILKFKVVNDLFDIQSGDHVLRHVYRTIESSLEQGELIARCSADTFSLLLFVASRTKTEARLASFVEAVNEPNPFLSPKYRLNLCFGVYPVQDPNQPMIQLQDRATMARKQCKAVALTQSCICRYYSQADQIRLAREDDMEHRMQEALEQGEFVIYLQAKQFLEGQGVAGAEALVRWLDPVRGLVPPDKFIPLFEQNGFIVALDLYVFDRVCALLNGWQVEGKQMFPISVNLSRVHLRDPNFLLRYEAIRSRWNVPAACLEFEVTETLALENPGLMAILIDELHRLGYHCSMDDFGSGYSSLNMLKDIRVDTLKLDRAFFSSALLDDPWEAAIISAVVDLARRLHMHTVAEGVETPQQAEFLRTAGCDIIQGFLFARPLPIKLFEDLVFGISLPPE